MRFETRIFSIFLIICMAVGVVFNARSEQGIFEEHSLFSDKTTLRLWYTDDGITPYLQSVAVKYSESNDVRVEPKLVSGLEYLEAINKASLEGENYPDIFVATNDTLEKAYFSGLALGVDNSDGFFNKVLFPKAALDSVTYNGNYIAYPFYFETSALIYNKDYLEEWAEEQIKEEMGIVESSEEDYIDEELTEEADAENSDEKADSDDEEDSESSDDADSESSDEGDSEASEDAGSDNSDEASEEEAAEVEIPPEQIEAKVAESVPTTMRDILEFAGDYTAPNRVRTVFEWDVTDILYNYFFVGNYMNICGEAGDDAEAIDIYNGNTISCMEIYRALKQFFATDATEISYDKVADDFIDGKIVYTIATTDFFKKLEEKTVIGGGKGVFFDFGVAPIPNLDDTYKSRTMSVTNCMVINGYSEHPKEANDFARYICSDTSEDIYNMSHKLAAHYGIDYEIEGLNTFVDVYAGSASLPKTMQASNFWMELEIAFTKIWNESENDICNETLKELSEKIKTQVKGEQVVEETIPNPPVSLITAGLKEDSD